MVVFLLTTPSVKAARAVTSLMVEQGTNPVLSARPIIRPKCTARALATGRLPGSPRHTGQVRVLGGSPKDSSQPQNIFVRVASCTWISRPITASRAPEAPPAGVSVEDAFAVSDKSGAPVEGECALERVGDVE